jgi:cell division protein FtsQ
MSTKEKERKPVKKVRKPAAAGTRRKASGTATAKKPPEPARTSPDVVYLPPKPFNRGRLLLHLATVVAVVVALVLGLSVFFKVDKVVVYGNHAYSAYTVQEAGGIETGSNLLSLNNTRACGKIMAELPYVENVRIGIKLPDTVNIYVEEIDIAYAITTQDGTYWLMTSAGKVVEQINAAIASGYTKIEGVHLDSPVAGEMARAVEIVQETTDGADPTEATAAPVVTGAARLGAALNILQQLEANDIVGEAASIDVGSLSNIELWYGQRFQVKLGDAANMAIKISWMKAAVNQRSDYDMGVLDVSFTTWPDRIGYTPFAE